MNLDYAKPFSNTSDLKNMTPKIHPSLAEKKQELKDEKLRQQTQRDSQGFNSELLLKEDPLSRLISNAREAEGKRASK